LDNSKIRRLSAPKRAAQFHPQPLVAREMLQRALQNLDRLRVVLLPQSRLGCRQALVGRYVSLREGSAGPGSQAQTSYYQSRSHSAAWVHV